MQSNAKPYTSSHFSSHWLRSGAAIMCMASALALAGCSTTDRTTTGSVPKGINKPLASMNVAELNRAAQLWGESYRKQPKNKSVGLNYAQALRITGRTEQALAVMRQMVIFHPNDNQVLAAYGKAQADAGQFEGALVSIRKAQRPDSPDWKMRRGSFTEKRST